MKAFVWGILVWFLDKLLPKKEDSCFDIHEWAARHETLKMIFQYIFATVLIACLAWCFVSFFSVVNTFWGREDAAEVFTVVVKLLEALVQTLVPDGV